MANFTAGKKSRDGKWRASGVVYDGRSGQAGASKTRTRDAYRFED